MKNIQTRMAALKANYKKLALLFVGSLLIIAGASAFYLKADNPDAIVGVWKTGEGTAMVRIYKNGDKYQGKIVWLKKDKEDDGGPRIDKNNPDTKKRKNLMIGLQILNSFKYYKNDKVWDDGTIYDPKNGKTYSCKITQNANGDLNIRGFIGFSLIGRSELFTKIKS